MVLLVPKTSFLLVMKSIFPVCDFGRSIPVAFLWARWSFVPFLFARTTVSSLLDLKICSWIRFKASLTRDALGRAALRRALSHAPWEEICCHVIFYLDLTLNFILLSTGAKIVKSRNLTIELPAVENFLHDEGTSSRWWRAISNLTGAHEYSGSFRYSYFTHPPSIFPNQRPARLASWWN